MHVGILTAIVRHGRPIGVEFLGAGAMRGLPEPPLQDVADVGDEFVRAWMPNHLCTGGGEQNERVAIGELFRLAWPVVVERPEIAAVLVVAVAMKNRLHSVIDEIGRARPSEEMAKSEAMEHAGRRMQRAHPIGLDRVTGIVERMKTSLRIERFVLKEGKERVGLILQPAAVAGVLTP